MVSVPQGFERGSILLHVPDAPVTEVFNALEMQTSSGDLRDARLLLLCFPKSESSSCLSEGDPQQVHVNEFSITRQNKSKRNIYNSLLHPTRISQKK